MLATDTHGREQETARNRCRCSTIRRRAVTELAGAVVAPAVDRAPKLRIEVETGHAASLVSARTYRREAKPARDRHGCRAIGHCAVPVLARAIVSPTVCDAAKGHPAGVIAPCAYRLKH